MPLATMSVVVRTIGDPVLGAGRRSTTPFVIVATARAWLMVGALSGD